jgi:hypothetical protein
VEAPHGPSEDLQEAAVEGDHVVRPGSDFEQVHDGEGTRGQLAAVDAGGYAPRADSARLVRGRRHEFPLIPPDRSYPRCQTRCSVTAKQRLVSRQVTRGWLVGLQVSPQIRDWGRITLDRTADRGVRRCRCTLPRRAPRGCVRARVDPAGTRRTSEGGQVRGSIQPGRLTRSRRARLLAAGLLLGVVSVAGCTGSPGATGRGGAAAAGAVSGCLLPPAYCYAPHVFRVAYGIQPLLDRGSTAAARR